MTHQHSPQPIDRQARFFLQVEGLAMLAAGAAAFGWLGGNYLFLIPLLLVPDVSMAGYLAGPRLGAFTYNVVHNWAFGLAVAAAGLATGWTPLTLAGSVLVAHTGMDRSLGYGLKLASDFHDTHLGRIGRGRKPDAAVPTASRTQAAEIPSR